MPRWRLPTESIQTKWPSRWSKTAASPHIPGASEPMVSSRPSTFAGVLVEAAMASSSGIPMACILLTRSFMR